MNLINGEIKYNYNDELLALTFNTEGEWRAKGIKIVPAVSQTNGTSHYAINIIPDKKIVIKELVMSLPVKYSSSDRIFANGYESWTESREFKVDEVINPLDKSLMSSGLAYQADYLFYPYTGEKGVLHSFSYTYIKQADRQFRLLASLSEDTGFTVFEHRAQENMLLIKKECEDLEINNEYKALDIVIAHGEEQYVFDMYFNLLGLNKTETKPCTGWTSWYYYYNKISEDIIMENLNAFSKRKIPIDFFQIDDGYQQVVGDWTKVNSKFPQGMKYIAGNIKKRGYKAGLWLAPFFGGAASELYINHPDWVICDDNGQPIKVGSSSAWGGDYFAMDIYNEGFRNHLKEVFHTILEDWGFDMVKLDFLYAACIFKTKDKTRGQIMCDAMKLLRDITGNKMILGCGVPLAPSFGLVDYCRVGCDVALDWEDDNYKNLNFRERNSTINSLRSTIGRHHLNGHAFLNDPDVFILRSTNIELANDQKYTLTLLNNIFGGLCFTSDNINEYSKEEMYLYKSLFPMRLKNMDDVFIDGNFMKVEFSIDNLKYMALSNLGETIVSAELAKGLYYSSKTESLSTGGNVTLRPYESVCFLKAVGNDYEIIGSQGHIFPASEVTDFKINGEDIIITADSKSLNQGHILINLPADVNGCRVNGRFIKAYKADNLNLIKVKI